MTWADFDKLEVTVTNDFGMEFIAEFEDNSGVTMIQGEDGEPCYVFNLLTEDIEEQLFDPLDMDEMDELFTENAMPELIMYSQERIEYDKN